MNATRWLDMRLKPTYKLLLDLIFDKGLKNHNEFFELLFPLPHFLVHLEHPITPTWLPTVAQKNVPMFA
jgi:hypothetical protein